MISEGKTGKYLKYAFGEIILVVIGILIALYINNWNQNRQQENEELNSLKFLKAEFEGNLQKFDGNFEKQKIRLAVINNILFEDLSQNTLWELDSIYQLSFYSWTYNPSFSTYNSLISSGKMNQFSNDSLKIKLAEFKDLVTDYQEDEENLWVHSKEQLFVHELYETKIPTEVKFNLRERTPNEVLNDKSLYLELFENTEYRNKLTLARLHLELIIGEGGKVREELIELNERIDSSINRFK